MQEYAKKNFEKALQLPMPNKTFAKLKATAFALVVEKYLT